MYKAIYHPACSSWKASGRYSRSHTCSGVRFSRLSNTHHMGPWLYVGMFFSLTSQAQTTDSQSCRRSFTMLPGQLQGHFSQTMNSLQVQKFIAVPGYRMAFCGPERQANIPAVSSASWSLEFPGNPGAADSLWGQQGQFHQEQVLQDTITCNNYFCSDQYC